MKVYFYNELYEKNNDELLDLLSTYIYLRNDIREIINEDKENSRFYLENYSYFYVINIVKIKETLELKELIRQEEEEEENLIK